MAKSSKLSRFFEAIQNALVGLRRALFNLVLTFFEEVNKRIRSRIPQLCMERESEEHVRSLVKALKFVVLPASLLYVTLEFFIGEIALDSMLFGLLLFIYSNFVPDLPSICEKKKHEGTTEDLPWYKKYSLLLFAPLFIWALFSGTQCRWRTCETFHNFRSLTVYASFLLLIGVVFMYPPFTIADLTELVSAPLYGIAGYLTHLKVDRSL